jgi:thiosulfate/3-mercaptopyruvate sulfurtransferase
LLFFTLTAPPESKPRPKEQLLVSFDALERRLGSPDLRLIDSRTKEEYDKGHIPGALWVDSKKAESLAKQPNAFSDSKIWEEWIASLGIDSEMEVLIYDGSRQLDAARLWWLLSYLGVDRVGLIDGNFTLWSSEKRPVSTDPVKVDPRPYPVKLRDDRHATKLDVLFSIKNGNAQVIDARSVSEHTGAEKKSKRGGRVPESCHLEWTTLVDKNGRFIDDSALQGKLSTLGVKPGQALITHCQGGGRASVDAFALERLGYPTRNYYLGWSDWGNDEDTPIENGPAKPAKK